MKTFNEYTHSIPIIYSHLENQYPYELHQGNNYQILFTEFDFHYCAGDIPKDKNSFIKIIENYIKKHHKKELILFGPNKMWNTFLEEAIKAFNGVIDIRYSFTFDETKYTEIIKNHTFKNNVITKDIKEPPSSIEYPQATINGDPKISFAKAFMLGKHNGEINVFVGEEYRRNGYGFETVLTLLKELMNRGITPNWTSWKAKESSYKLALKCGFKLEREIKAFIWVEEMKKI